MASYGQYNYESTESRALKSIRADSYNKDLAKNIIQLNNNSEYMAQYLRKLQKGVDEANENVIEQITGLISDIFVLFAGGSDTGLEFGDLKYVFQAIGALFGFSDPDRPINLFAAAWHFFSTYIVPVNSFDEVINLIIDNAIAFILDVFGEIPIVGEALQTFAQWILDLRDNFLMPIFNVIMEIIQFFTGQSSISEFFNVVTKSLLSIFSPLKARNLNGKINENNVDRVPITALFNGRSNALDNPIFADEASIEPNGEFEYDSTVTFNPAKNKNGGSAKCVADGFEHELYSNAISVDAKTEVNVSVQTKWDSITASATPIKLKVAFFSQDVEVSVVEIDNISVTSGSGGWVELSGEVECPPDVDEARMILNVTDDTTAGTVWFSDADMNKNYLSGIAPIDWIIDLPEALGGLGEFSQWIVDAISEIITGIGNVGVGLGEFFGHVWDWFEDTLATAGQAADALFQALGISRILTRVFTPTEDPGLAETEQAVLNLNGRIVALEGSGTVITHTVSGTWTNPTPTEHNLITFVCINGGDGGAKGGSNIVENNKGGRGGGYIQKSFYTDELPATVAMTIGAGGAGFTATGGGSGGSGAVTSFGSLLVGLKGVGAVFKTGGAIPYETGVSPGDGGSGGYMAGDSASRIWEPSENGTGGPFAPGGLAGFGNLTAEVVGKNGSAAPASIPSGGGGGGGGSITFQSFQNIGPGGNGGFPGGGGGGGASSVTSDANGGNGAAGCIYEIRQW